MDMLDPAIARSVRGRLLRLAPSDNVAVATAGLEAGQSAGLDDAWITLVDRIPLGHKVALAAIAPGEKVVKCGCPIGSATREIRVGQHVHVHNLKSDYFPTFTRQQRAEVAKEPPT
ncbi:MAG: UxaA family hydrolase [Thermoguttaceae bacterium]|jgi:altronate dehydratase